MRSHRESLDKQGEELRSLKVDQEKLRVQVMIERRSQQESQLTQVITQIQEAKERLMAVNEQRDNERR